jgi:glycosyltransferase involved in cell wall biosynthesis
MHNVYRRYPGERGLKRPIRLGFVLRSFTYGGAEHDIIQLITESDPRVLEFVGMAVQTPFPICPDLRLDHPRVPPIYQPGAVTRHPKVVDSDSFVSAVKMVAAEADVLVEWGVSDLADFVPPDFRGRIVVTSKASGEFQESFLHANALLTSDYVANSMKSAEAFPFSVRHRAHVIYPGVEQRRIECRRDRTEQRAAWGLGPDDRIVGYLGRIAPDKGVEQLVKSVSGMAKEWKAVFVGRNGNFSEYERRFARLCSRLLPGRYRIIDWTTEIGNTLTAFDVLAYPTEDEGFSNSLAEAWLLGVPTVTTAGVGALAEPHWADCAITIPRDFTPPELSRALEAAVSNTQLVSRARRRAQALTVESTLIEWQRYFTELVQRPRRTRVMVLLPNLMIGGIPCWLLTLIRQTPTIDWCCVCVLSEFADHAADPEMVAGILKEGCPVLGIPRLPVKETKQRLLQAIRQTRPDVVLQSGVKRLDERFPNTDIPLVTISHGPSECDWARDVLANSSRRATHRVAISKSSRDAFAKALRPEVTIITNGVEIPAMKELRPMARRRARHELGVAKGEIAVGFIGRLSPEKNPLCVAQAVASLPPAYRAIFIGPDCANLVTKIRKVAPRSVHFGPVSPLKVGELLPGLDVLVCPSDYESFGLAIVEAWAAMVPVVSTRVGIVAELVDELDVAVVVPIAPSPATLAGAIRRAHDEREQRIHSCRVVAGRDYDARRMGQDWQEYLRAVTGQRGPVSLKRATQRYARARVSERRGHDDERGRSVLCRGA